MIVEYLHRLEEVINCALGQSNRVFAFRAELRFPAGTAWESAEVDSRVITRFIESFKAKIRHNRQCAKQLNPYAHDSAVRYVWAREVGKEGSLHYHVLILLNGHAFNSLGEFALGRDNNYNRVNEAWASALGLHVSQVSGLVQFPVNPMYRVERHDQKEINDLFHRTSYLCKADTKYFGTGVHGFGASRG